MKIYTKVVMDWDGNVLEEESYEYNGPVAQCGGGGSTKSETNTKAEPWKGVQPYLTGLYGDSNQLYQQGLPQYYPGQTYVDRDPLENYAQAQNLQYAMQQMPGMVSETQGAVGQMLRAPDVANNPYVAGMADTIQRRMNQNLAENQLPLISNQATSTGQYGGSREGIAQGTAIGKTNEAYGDALNQLYGGAYTQGLRQQASGVGYAPGIMQMGFAPSDTIGGVGAYMRGEQEKALQEDMARYGQNTMIPFETADWYNRMLSGIPWGQGVDGSTSQKMDPLQMALGVGGLGLGAYNAGLFGGLGTAAAPALGTAAGMIAPTAALSFGATAAPAAAMTLPGAAAAVAPAAMFSDRRLKKDIKPVGEWNGYNWYTYRYKDESMGAGIHLGVMADEVEKINPEAVHTLKDGFKVVDYGAL